MLRVIEAVWLRSCTSRRHNMVGRGERELRGERRGQDGRPSATTVAPSLYVPLLLLLLPALAAAQQWRVEAHAGVLLSGDWVQDEIRAPAASSGTPAAAVTAAPAPGLAVSLTAVGPLRPNMALDLAAGWSRAMLQAEDESTRDVNPVQSAHALVGLRYRLANSVYAGAGIGALRTWGDEVPLFDGRAEISPLGEASLGFEPDLGGLRIVLRAAAQIHRFNARALEERGGDPAWISRFFLGAGLAFGGQPW